MVHGRSWENLVRVMIRFCKQTVEKTFLLSHDGCVQLAIIYIYGYLW